MHRKGGEPAESLRPAVLYRGEVIVGDRRRAAADLLAAPHHAGSREREKCHVDAALVHLFQPPAQVEHARKKRDEVRAVGVDHPSAAEFPQLEPVPAVLSQKFDPFLGHHVRVYVYDFHCLPPHWIPGSCRPAPAALILPALFHSAASSAVPINPPPMLAHSAISVLTGISSPNPASPARMRRHGPMS